MLRDKLIDSFDNFIQPIVYSNLDSLLTAAENGQLARVKQLVDSQLTVNSKSIHGVTPLVSASAGGHITVMKWLVEQGAEINAPGTFNALHAASSQGHISAVKWLLQRQALINIKDNCNRTPLHYAVMGECTEIVALLLEEGSININARDNDHMTPLHYAAESGYKEIVKLLVEHGAYVYLNDCSQYTFYTSGNDPFTSEKECFYATLLLAGVRTKKSRIDSFDTIRDTNLQARVKSMRAYIEEAVTTWLYPLMLNHCQENLKSDVISDVLQSLPYLIQSLKKVKAQTIPTLTHGYNADALKKFLLIVDENRDATITLLVNSILDRNTNEASSTRYAPIPVEIVARIRKYLIDSIWIDKLIDDHQLKYPIAYYLWHDGMNRLKEYELFYRALFIHDWQEPLLLSSIMSPSSL